MTLILGAMAVLAILVGVAVVAVILRERRRARSIEPHREGEQHRRETDSARAALHHRQGGFFG